MKSRRSFLAAISTLILASAVLPQQATPPAAENSLPTIKKEAGLVVVDAVVTDKKGNYIRDLTAKDFRVFEDNKEQTIKSFSSESNAAAPTVDQHRYLVLFFDNSTMSLADQGFARQSALKFLDTNAGANRYIAVVDFGGALRIAQNFTTDVARLKQAAGDPKFSGVSPNSANAGIAQLGNVSANFGARTFLLALRDLATGLAAVPGRKTLVLLSEGFPLRTADWEIQAELVAAINACNKANVAVYPIDVRGVGAVSTAPPLPIAPASESARLMSATLRLNADGDEPAIALDGGQNATHKPPTLSRPRTSSMSRKGVGVVAADERAAAESAVVRDEPPALPAAAEPRPPSSARLLRTPTDKASFPRLATVHTTRTSCMSSRRELGASSSVIPTTFSAACRRSRRSKISTIFCLVHSAGIGGRKLPYAEGESGSQRYHRSLA